MHSGKVPCAVRRARGAAVDEADRRMLGQNPGRVILRDLQARPDRAPTRPTRARAPTATVHWLEAIYTWQRRHSAIDLLSPVDYEERYWDRRAAA